VSYPDVSTPAALDLRQLARSLVQLLDSARQLALAEQGTNELAVRVEEHLGVPPQDLPVVSQSIPTYQLVDVQVAIDKWVEGDRHRSSEIIGVRGWQRRSHTFGELLGTGRTFRVGIGPADYVDVPDSPDSTKSCIQFGIFLMADEDERWAMLIRIEDRGPFKQAVLEVVSQGKTLSQQLLAELRRLAVQHSVLRGQVLTLTQGEGEYGAFQFLRRPTLRRDELVLPESTLSQIEEHVVGVAHHRDRLLAAGQHLKRGVLLYGPPGTGKTHTVRYLLSQLTGVTAFVLSGQGLRLFGQACSLARLLEPSLVVLEDVDLVAADRSFGPMGNPLLFELLNQIDGLGEDADVTFLLTTNRVDILERALSERPGRVDVAVEIAVPDSDGRLRLFRLYGKHLGVAELSDDDLASASGSTEGRTATYIREVVRRAAMAAAVEEGTAEIRVSGEMLERAASELLADRSALTRSLLGGPVEPDAEPPIQGGAAFASRGWAGYGPMKGRQEPKPFGAAD
jgi:ATP-dependent 26S proteasome regulatory subunit